MSAELEFPVGHLGGTVQQAVLCSQEGELAWRWSSERCSDSLITHFSIGAQQISMKCPRCSRHACKLGWNRKLIGLHLKDFFYE